MTEAEQAVLHRARAAALKKGWKIEKLTGAMAAVKAQYGHGPYVIYDQPRLGGPVRVFAEGIGIEKLEWKVAELPDQSEQQPYRRQPTPQERGAMLLTAGMLAKTQPEAAERLLTEACGVAPSAATPAAAEDPYAEFARGAQQALHPRRK